MPSIPPETYGVSVLLYHIPFFGLSVRCHVLWYLSLNWCDASKIYNKCSCRSVKRAAVHRGAFTAPCMTILRERHTVWLSLSPFFLIVLPLNFSFPDALVFSCLLLRCSDEVFMFIWPQLLLQYAPMQGPELMSKQNIISLRFLSIILENVECFFFYCFNSVCKWG